MSKLKKLLALTLALILAMSLLTACGAKTNSSTPGSDTSNSPASTSSDPNRALNIAISGDTGTLYPFAASGGFVSLMYAFYEPLWDFKADGTKVNILASDWQKVSDTEYKLTIRDGVKFSNGNPLTAEDVMFSMKLCKEDPRFYLNVKVIDFDKTKVTGDYTMDIFYTTYDCTQEVSFTQLMILDKESYNLESLSTKPIGTGPYIATDYIVNSHVTCEARKDYWGEPAKISKVNFKVINEQAQIVNALEVGDIDITSTIPVDEADYVKSLGYVVDSSFGGYANTALYSMAGALSSKEARWAVSYAMDRESMSKIMYKGLSSVPSYPSSEHAQDYETRFSNMHDTYATGYNVEKAKQYAEQSGLVGKTLKIITNGTEAFNDVAVAMQENLRAIGIESTIASYDSATYFSIIMDEKNFDIALFYLSSPSQMASDVMANYVDFIPLGWKGADRDKYGEISKQAVHTYDPTERGNLMYEALKIFVDVDPWYAICEAVSPRAQSSDLVGVEYYIAGNLYYDDISFK
jgi:peptide/nickel transport system substrate-binding protein